MKQRWKNKTAYFVLGIFLAILMAFGMKDSNEVLSAQASTEGNMEVHYIDVGQGDATLIKMDDHAMLIDAGCEDSGTKLQLYLAKQGINSLDYLILTHPDSDHVGGGDVILTKFDCGTVITPDCVKATDSWGDIEAAMKYKGYQAVHPTVGSTYQLGDAQFIILAPNCSYEDANNSSIALLVTYGNNRFLFTGDAEEKAENDILANGLDIKADVYQAGHHGSRSSSSEAFMQAVKPSYAVISCGADNTYGHPHAEVLNRFRSMGIQVYRTDEQGTLVAVSDGTTITWNASPSTTWKAGEPTQTQDSSDTSHINLTPEEQQSTQTQQATAVQYILNTNTHKFHRPSCSSVSQMKEKNKKISNESRENIIEQGYEPCKKCNP